MIKCEHCGVAEERDAAIARADALENEILLATKTHGDAVAFYVKERDTLKAALRAAGNRLVYALQLEAHKSECGCVDCRMVRNIDALLGEKE
jgi:hypothetical protein